MTTGPFDVENALRVVTRMRRRRDEVIVQQVKLGDQMATSTAAETPSESLESAGIALLHAAGRLGGLLVDMRGSGATDNITNLAAICCNIQGFAGERLVRDARAIDGANL